MAKLLNVVFTLEHEDPALQQSIATFLVEEGPRIAEPRAHGDTRFGTWELLKVISSRFNVRVQRLEARWWSANGKCFHVDTYAAHETSNGDAT